jgi:hypothetical protein
LNQYFAGLLVPKKGFTPQSLSKSFHFNEIPLSIEYTNLSHFSILSTWSTCSMGCYGFRLKVATTPSKNVENMDTITSALKTQRELDAYTCFGSSGLKVRIPLGQIGRKLTLDSAWPVLERTVPVIDCRRPSGNVVYRPSAGIRQLDIIGAVGARHRSIIVWKA